MSKGIVYIMTNPCLDGWVKIGMTERDDIDERLRELNQPTNIPLSFRCYATYRVDKPKDVEDHIHSIIDQVDISLHAREKLDNGKVREREFFKISPERAFNIFKDVFALRNNSNDKLELSQMTKEQANEQEVVEKSEKRSNNSFELLKIPVGSEIKFINDDAITAKVLDTKNQVEFNGKSYSVTGLAVELLITKCGWAEDVHVSGWRYFTYDGLSLSDRRNSIEENE